MDRLDSGRETAASLEDPSLRSVYCIGPRLPEDTLENHRGRSPNAFLPTASRGILDKFLRFLGLSVPFCAVPSSSDSLFGFHSSKRFSQCYVHVSDQLLINNPLAGLMTKTTGFIFALVSLGGTAPVTVCGVRRSRSGKRKTTQTDRQPGLDEHLPSSVFQVLWDKILAHPITRASG